MKNSIQNTQLAVYAIILSLTLIWLVGSVSNTALVAIREGQFATCFTGHHHQNHHHHHLWKQNQPGSSNNLKEDHSFDNQGQSIDYANNPENIIITMPPVASDDDKKHSNLIVSDLLVKTRKINIFASLTRDFQPIASRLNDQAQNTTVLAPLNSAINALPRKPWEDPEDYERLGEAHAYTGADGQERAKRNLQRFVEAHLVPVSPWREGQEVETVGGGKVRWVKEGGTIFVSATSSGLVKSNEFRIIHVSGNGC